MEKIEELLQKLKQGQLIVGLNKYINPKKDAKFSPNLYRYFTWGRYKGFPRIYQDSKNNFYYLGFVQDEWFCGCQLMRIFCVGCKAEHFAYAPKDAATFEEITTWFWNKYFEVGKGIYSLPEWHKPNY